MPIIKDVLGVRVAGWYSSGGGYIENASSGEKNVNDAEIRGVRGTALFQPNDKFKLTVAGTYQKIGVDGTQRYQLSLGPYAQRLAHAGALRRASLSRERGRRV